MSYGGTITSSGNYKGRTQILGGLRINCGWAPWKDCCRTSCGGGGIILEINGTDGWQQARAIMKRVDGIGINNPTLEELLANSVCGSFYDENGVLVTSCFYNNLFIEE